MQLLLLPLLAVEWVDLLLLHGTAKNLDITKNLVHVLVYFISNGPKSVVCTYATHRSWSAGGPTSMCTGVGNCGSLSGLHGGSETEGTALLQRIETSLLQWKKLQRSHEMVVNQGRWVNTPFFLFL